MIKIKRLWGDAKFQSLSPDSKLLYIYLATCPQLNTLGVCNLTYDYIMLTTGLDFDVLVKASDELKYEGYIHKFSHIEQTYFYLPRHFMSHPKVERTFEKGREDLAELDEGIRTKMYFAKVLPDLNQYAGYKAPEEKEVAEYAMELGYYFDAKKFIEYYAERGWKDAKGRVVKNWKSKVRYWTRDSTPIPAPPNAPKGFEHFYVLVDGEIVTPTYWSNEVPFYRGSFTLNKKLQEEYATQINSN